MVCYFTQCYQHYRYISAKSYLRGWRHCYFLAFEKFGNFETGDFLFLQKRERDETTGPHEDGYTVLKVELIVARVEFPSKFMYIISNFNFITVLEKFR